MSLVRFGDIRGNRKVSSLLRRAIEGGRVAHAYLFAGPPGVGKLSAARAMAAALNCEAYAGDSCGECAPCRAMAEGAQLNYIEVEPEKGLLKIDKIRELQKILSYRLERGRRVVVLNGAEHLVRGAANAFLKTLEEPTAGSTIILITPSPDSLLPTILSRTQRVNFRPLGVSEVVAELGDYDLSSEQKKAAAMLSGGSITRARQALDQGVFARRAELFEGLASLGTSNGAEILDEAAALAKDAELPELLELLKGWYRDRIVAGYGCGDFVVNRDILKGAASGAYEVKGLARAYGAVEEARVNITPPRYGNKALTIETMLMTLRAVEAGR